MQRNEKSPERGEQLDFQKMLGGSFAVFLISQPFSVLEEVTLLAIHIEFIFKIIFVLADV